MSNTIKSVEKLITLIKKLRANDGCEWDKAQTPQSLLPLMRKELKELNDGITNSDVENIKEEIGDIFILLLMIISIYEEMDKFSLNEIIENSCRKITRRHPHVFGKRKNLKKEEVIAQWKKIKKSEKSNYQC